MALRSIVGSTTILDASRRFRRKVVPLQLVALTAGVGANALQQGRGLVLPLCSFLSAMLALVGPAHSEGAPRESTANQLPAGRALTIADLEGVKVKIKLVIEMLVRREDGPQGPVTQDTDWNITVEPEGKIGWSYQPTVHTRLGDRAGQKITTTATLDKPWYTPNGEATWQFTDGTLLFVRSFRNGGAYRMSIAFRQDGQNLACSAASTFARERGKDNITMNSAIDGVPVTIFSWKAVSSTCEVTR